MKDRLFLKYFFLIVFSLSTIAYVFVTSVDAYHMFDKPWSIHCDLHKSEVLRQFELINQFENADVLIVGSSTSQNFMVQDIAEVFNLKAYHANSAGAPALARYIYVNQALRRFTDLKKIILVADFFEFNPSGDKIVPTLIYNQKTMFAAGNLEKLNLPSPSIFDKYLDIFSYQAVETALSHLGRCLNKRDYGFFNADGTATKDILINAITKADLESTPPVELQKMLELRVAENFVLYKRNAIHDFSELSPVVKNLYKQMVAEASDRGVELHIVASPYHKKFREQLYLDPQLQERHREWLGFLEGLASADQRTYVYNFSPHEKYFPDNAQYWRDGTHFSRLASYIILQKIKAGGKSE